MLRDQWGHAVRAGPIQHEWGRTLCEVEIDLLTVTVEPSGAGDGLAPLVMKARILIGFMSASAPAG